MKNRQYYSFSHFLLTNPLFALNNRQMLRQTSLQFRQYSIQLEQSHIWLRHFANQFEQSSVCNWLKQFPYLRGNVTNLFKNLVYQQDKWQTHIFFLITFKILFEIINYGKYFNRLQTVLCSNCFEKCLNQIRDFSSWIEYCLNYKEVCLSICRLFEANRELVKSKWEKLSIIKN